jgi:hypothetical protein
MLSYHNGPSISSRESSSLDLFVRGDDLAIYYSKFFVGSGWTEWKSLGGRWESDPAVVS